MWNARPLLVAETGLTETQVEHLLNRYGSLLPELLELITADPSLAQPLDSAPEYLRVEIVYAASHEGALHLDDILARRTRISIETWDRGVAAASEAAELVAAVLGWDAGAMEREIEHYHKRVAAERESQDQPDDLSADAARLGAPDVRMGGGRSASALSRLAVVSRYGLIMNAKPPKTLNDLIGAYIAEQCTVIIDAEDRLRVGENVVHTTRVAVRRLRSTIRVFADLFDVPQAGALEDELVWWAGLLGEVRDLDILTARLLDLLDDLPPEAGHGSGRLDDPGRTRGAPQGGRRRRASPRSTPSATGS